MSQFNNLNYLRSDRNLVLESAYSSRTVTSSDKLFHAILENNDTHKANHERNKANNWVANYDQGLLFRIAGKYINVPTFLSLHLVLDSLIKNGEDVNAIDKNKDTPLHLASRYGKLELVKLLIEHGADMNVKNNYGKTPLHWAIKNNNLEMAKLLVENGADVHTNSDNEEYTFKDKIETFGAFTFTAVAAIMVTNNDNEEFTLFSSDSISSKIQRTVVALTIIAAAVGTIMVATRK